MATAVPGQASLTGQIVTGGALHTVKATAGFICDQMPQRCVPCEVAADLV